MMVDPYLSFHEYNFDEDTRFLAGLKQIQGQNQTDDAILKAKLFYYSRFLEPIKLEDYVQWRKTHHSEGDLTEKNDGPVNHGSVEQPANATASEVEKQDFTEEDHTEVVMCKNNTDSKEQNQCTKDHVETRGSDRTAVFDTDEISKTGINQLPSSTESSTGSSGASTTNVEITARTDQEINRYEQISSKTECVSANSTCKDVESECTNSGDRHNMKSESGERELTLAEIMDLVSRGETVPGLQDLNITPTNTEPTQSNSTRLKKPWE